ncbi:aldo/keto reductase [Eubacterium oxidoreducens]|uniref:4Fe-4S ferredoxin-type domain-containing protein n=1 Tax=Eubacterium oxidoreducens TaxID=1732 RepID=A0A1G6AAP2_EUBOX|nr:aldo/keto reductase [Eubacterium oxidoreducens]SDB05472.1 hypothetical protein SAMN02910417_00358 [Eubacterium oxidoreducens]
MQYRVNPKNGDRLSQLGLGCMRFPKSEEETRKMIVQAVKDGVNYFDTAYIYSGSEETLGKIVKEEGLRDKIFIATKLPPYLVKKPEDLDKIFHTQLERLQTDYIDYYFMHMLTDELTWERLKGLGICEWIAQKKESGQIRNIGFSYHGGKEEFIKIIDAYDWEFCMIQYNYFDEHKQAGRSGLEYAHAKGLPVMIMEPLRGGKLVTKLPQKVYETFREADANRSPAEWALRWVWNHKEVTVVLSGMNSMQMLEENVYTASQAKAGQMSKEELALFRKVSDILDRSIKVACTACGYCMPCPRGVDIPTCFAVYNDMSVEGKWASVKNYLMQTSIKKEPHNASLCVDCGKCEQHCPQNIEIRKELKNVKRALEGIYYKPARVLIKKFFKF